METLDAISWAGGLVWGLMMTGGVLAIFWFKTLEPVWKWLKKRKDERTIEKFRRDLEKRV